MKTSLQKFTQWMSAFHRVIYWAQYFIHYSLLIFPQFIATFADDTAILVKYQDPNLIAQDLQMQTDQIKNWANQWRIRINEHKSTKVVFAKCSWRSTNSHYK